MSLLLLGSAQAQTPSNFVSGQVLNASDLNAAFAAKTDFPGGASPGGVSGNVQYNNGGVFGGYTDAQLTSHCVLFSASLAGCVPSPGTAPPAGSFLRSDGQWAVPSGSTGGTSLVINSTTITGGTVGNILSHGTGGILQEYAPAGFLSFFGSQSANTFLSGPCTGAAAVPTWRIFCSQDLDAMVVTGTRGSLLERGASGWTQLVPVANGNILVDRGPGADPQYNSASSWFDTAYCNTVGFIIVRFTGAWTCSKSIAANPVWWGADASGTTDSTNAINATIAAGPSVVAFPAGTFKIGAPTPSTNPHNIALSSSIRIEGASWLTTTIQTADTTADIFTVTAASKISNIALDVTSGTVKTAGAMVNFAAADSYSELSNFNIRHYFTGVQFSGAGNSQSIRVFNGGIQLSAGTSSIGILVNQTTNSVDLVFRDIFISGNTSGSQASAGIKIQNAGDLTIDRVETLFAGDGLQLVPVSGQTIQFITVSNSLFDSGSGVGINIGPASGGTVQLAKIVSSWAASNLSGVVLQGAGNIQEVNLTNCSCVGNSQHGLLINTTTATNTRVLGGSFAGNTNGISAVTSAGRFSIVGARIGPTGQFVANATGINLNLTGSNTGFLIGNNDISGNTTGITVNAPTSFIIANNDLSGNANPLVLAGYVLAAGANGRITDNLGYNPVGSSTVTPGASIWTYRAGPSPESHYLSGGTVQSLGINGQAVPYNPTLTYLQLSPNELYQLQYTVAPTVFRQVH